MTEEFESQLSVNDVIGDLENEDRYDSRLIGIGLKEIFSTGEYASFFINERDGDFARSVEASHMALLTPSGTYNLAKFFPTTDRDTEERLDRVLKEEIKNIEVKWEIEPEDVQKAFQVVKDMGLHVLGAIQIGKFSDGQRSTELIFPKVFSILENDLSYAVNLSAGFVRAVQI